MNVIRQEPPQSNWEKYGMEITPEGLIIVATDDWTEFRIDKEGLKEIIKSQPRLLLENEKLKEVVRIYNTPEFIAQTITSLERKADHCDKSDQYSASAAYSDAARMLRKALKE